MKLNEDGQFNGCKTSTIADDTIEYRIYSTQDDINWKNIRRECMAVMEDVLSDGCVIWNEQPFNLTEVTAEGKVKCLFGRTRYNESVDDEWLVIFLLRIITEKLTSLFAYVEDCDGQLLLIEAAKHIPRWLEPTNSANRVFIGRGKVVILPLNENETVLNASGLKIEQSIAVMKKGFDRYFACDEVQKCIKGKTDQFPQKAFDSIHKVNVQIPLSAVHLLCLHPLLISRVVRNSASLDVHDMSKLRREKFQLPGEATWCQVEMSQSHYAQIDYKLRRKFKNSSLNKHEKAVEIGKVVKLGCELSYVKLVKEGALLNENRLKAYMASLKEKGYFQGELEGSKLYNELEAKAKEAFSMSDCSEDREGQIIKKFFNTWSQEKYENLQVKIGASLADLPAESHDDFMNVDIDEMTKEMTEGFKRLHQTHEQKKKKEADFEQINKFVSSKSDFTGIETSQDQGPVDFDPETFMNYLKQNLDDLSSEDEDFLREEFSSCSDDDEGRESPCDLNEMREVYEQYDSFLKNTKVVCEEERGDVAGNLVRNFAMAREGELPSDAATVLMASASEKNTLFDELD